MSTILNKQTNRIILEIFLGTFLGIILCYFLIKAGYNQIDSSAVKEYTVQLFGFSIYEIKEINGKLNGVANNNSMMFIGILFSMLVIIIMELLFARKNRGVKK